MKHTSHIQSIYDYLEQSGVLEWGTEEEIASAKRKYWKDYHVRYKRKRRKKRPEYSVSLSKDEYRILKREADRHHLSVTAYLRKSSLAYAQRIYIVPDEMSIARMEQTLGTCLNEIQKVVHTKPSNIFQEHKQYTKLRKQIERIEHMITTSLRTPPSLERYIIKAIQTNPGYKNKLIAFLKRL